MLFKINPIAGQPIYLQITQQIRHAIDTGVLQHGELLPSIRTLAEELIVSHNTVAKAYSELEQSGLLELRHGSGAYVAAKRSTKSRTEKVRAAQQRIRSVVKSLQDEGFSEEEIQRLFETQWLPLVSGKEPP
jgi:GntR family transcriptional regulator